MEEMHRRQFSRLPVRHHEARTGALLCPSAIFGFARVLQISRRPKALEARSGARTAIAEDRQETSARPYPSADRRAAGGAVEVREESRRASVDATAGRRDHGTFLQQRPGHE